MLLFHAPLVTPSRWAIVVARRCKRRRRPRLRRLHPEHNESVCVRVWISCCPSSVGAGGHDSPSPAVASTSPFGSNLHTLTTLVCRVSVARYSTRGEWCVVVSDAAAAIAAGEGMFGWTIHICPRTSRLSAGDQDYGLTGTHSCMVIAADSR